MINIINKQEKNLNTFHIILFILNFVKNTHITEQLYISDVIFLYFKMEFTNVLLILMSNNITSQVITFDLSTKSDLHMYKPIMVLAVQCMGMDMGMGMGMGTCRQ